MTMNFATATRLGCALWGGANEYDRWAQAEQIRLLLDYAHWLELANEGCNYPRALPAKAGAL